MISSRDSVSILSPKTISIEQLLTSLLPRDGWHPEDEPNVGGISLGIER